MSLAICLRWASLATLKEDLDQYGHQTLSIQVNRHLSTPGLAMSLMTTSQAKQLCNSTLPLASLWERSGARPQILSRNSTGTGRMLLCRFVTDNNAIDDNILHAVNSNINIRSLIIKLSFKVLHLVLYLSLRTGQVGFFFFTCMNNLGRPLQQLHPFSGWPSSTNCEG